MDGDYLQAMCEQGQLYLIKTRYLDAAQQFAQVEQLAWDARAFDTLARLYLPLQESRRQIRQRCSEGVVQLRHLATHSGEMIDACQILERTTHGQLLTGGWGTFQPAADIRRLSKERKIYLETFLAGVYPVLNAEPVVVLFPTENVRAPASDLIRSLTDLKNELPANCIVLTQAEIPPDAARGNTETFAGVMALWERLHTPFLEAALQLADPVQRMQAYRDTLVVDPACELAHQFLADIARTLARQR